MTRSIHLLRLQHTGSFLERHLEANSPGLEFVTGTVSSSGNPIVHNWLCVFICDDPLPISRGLAVLRPGLEWLVSAG